MNSSFKDTCEEYGITDIHILASDIKKSIIYSRENVDVSLDSMLSILKEESEKVLSEQEEVDFVVSYEGLVFRGAEVDAIDGKLYTLRLINPPTPLSELSMDKTLKKDLLSRGLNKGGIVLLTGLPGSGKTTLCVSSLIGRLEAFGGVCYTAEDPPEIVFHGKHKNGICHQVDVRKLGGFAPTIKNFLRAYPTNVLSLMLVGEIRDSETAEQVLMSALDGRLVFATMHAGSLTDAIKRFTALASRRLGQEMALDMTSTNLKLCVAQRMISGKVRQDYFKLTTSITSMIAAGKIEQLNSEFESQKISREKR